MMCCATVSAVLADQLPSITPVLRILGGVYLLYLARGVYRASSQLPADTDRRSPLGFWSGVGLQFINPKTIVYGLTVQTLFISPMIESSTGAIVASFILALVTFAAVSLWALAGHAIRSWMGTPRRALIVGAIFAGALIYTAIDLTGIFSS